MVLRTSKGTQGCDAAVVMVRHQDHQQLDLSALKSILRTPVLVDGRRVFGVEQARAAGLKYCGIGQVSLGEK